jgi:hypothetical protein
VSNNSGENEWYTPPALIEAARECMGGIDLDPATSEVAQATVRATRYFTAEHDGLAQPWSGKVWLNPPYAQPLIGQFIEKLVAEFRPGRVTGAVVLTNNATETGWGQSLLGASSAVCFPAGRLRFLCAAKSRSVTDMPSTPQTSNSSGRVKSVSPVIRREIVDCLIPACLPRACWVMWRRASCPRISSSTISYFASARLLTGTGMGMS